MSGHYRNYSLNMQSFPVCQAISQLFFKLRTFFFVVCAIGQFAFCILHFRRPSVIISSARISIPHRHLPHIPDELTIVLIPP